MSTQLKRTPGMALKALKLCAISVLGVVVCVFILSTAAFFAIFAYTAWQVSYWTMCVFCCILFVYDAASFVYFGGAVLKYWQSNLQTMRGT